MGHVDDFARGLRQAVTSRPIDLHAVRVPQASRLPPCLYVPVAARDVTAIETYVGKVVAPLSPTPGRAFLVEAHEPEAPDPRLAIWKLPAAAILQHPTQVWVHVDYTAYRRAYLRALPNADMTGLVLDHVMNRRLARLRGFVYLRIVPISRAPNSSHGGLSEGWAVELNRAPRMREINKASQAAVQYADLADVVKMLDIEGGGSLMQNVNDAQRLVELPPEARAPSI